MSDCFQFREQPGTYLGIEAIWRAAATDEHSIEYPVLPDGCMDLVLRCRVDSRGALTQTPELLVGGVRDDSYRVPMAQGTRCVGLRFAPGWGGAWLGVDAASVRGGNLPASELNSRLAMLASRLGDLRTIGAASELLLSTVSEPLRQDLQPRPRVLEAIQLLCMSGGRIHVEAIARHLSISVRTLHREVAAAVGLPPKTLAQIFRFQRALGLDCSQGLADLADAAGYADQSHMTRAFRQLGGFTPASRQRLEGLDSTR